MSATGVIRVALLGYGMAGSVFHAPLIDATDGLELVVVVTGDADRAAAARRRYPHVRVLADADEVWRRSDAVDLVVVATPNRTHATLATASLAAGLPLVVDKPVTTTAAEARRLRDDAAERRLLASVFHNRRYDGDARTVEQLLAEGSLGRVHRFESRFERWRPQVDPHRWRESPEPGDAGGLLFDLGSHLVDQALTLFGPARSVYAELGVVRPDAAVDDDVFVALEHVGGTRSHLWASAVASDLGPRMRVLGSRASYVVSGMDVQEAALVAGGSPRDAGWGVASEAAWGRLGTPGATVPVPTRAGAYQDYYAGIRRSLQTGAPPPGTLDSAIEVLDVLEAARTSARTGTVVPLR